MTTLVQRVRLGSEVHTVEWLNESAKGQMLLRTAYARNERLRCQCTPSAPELSIAKRNGRYFLRRMPGSGFLHSEQCNASLDALDILSGADVYADDVIVEDDAGNFRIVLEADRIERAEQPATAVQLDGLLDLMIETGNLNRTVVNRASRWSWSGLRTQLITAVQQIHVGQAPLSEQLHVVGNFDKERPNGVLDDLIEFAKRQPENGLVLCEIREISACEYSWRIGIKGIARSPVWLAKPLLQAIETRHGGPVFPPQASQGICLMRVRPSKTGLNVTNLAVRHFNDALIPSESPVEATIANRLHGTGKTIVRPLRFDSARERLLADFLVMEGDRLTPVFVLNPSGNECLDKAKQARVSLMQRNHVSALVFTQ